MYFVPFPLTFSIQCMSSQVIQWFIYYQLYLLQCFLPVCDLPSLFFALVFRQSVLFQCQFILKSYFLKLLFIRRTKRYDILLCSSCFKKCLKAFLTVKKISHLQKNCKQSITYFFPESLRVSYKLDAHHSLTFVCIFCKKTFLPILLYSQVWHFCDFTRNITEVMLCCYVSLRGIRDFALSCC